MTIEQKIFSKLEPHAKRINDGEGDDFDYLPAVLLQLMEEQKRQAKLLDDTTKLLIASIKTASDALGVQNKDTQIQLQNSQHSVCEQIAVFANAHAAHTTKTSDVLSAIGLKIDSFGTSAQRSLIVLKRLAIAGLVASTAIIGLAIELLRRH